MLRLILGLMLLVGASTVNAFDFQRYSGCVDIIGKEVQTVIGTTVLTAIAYHDEALGLVILFDRKVVRTYPQNVLDFIYLHECAHHKLGHLYKPKEEFDQLSFMYENEADCAAREEYKRIFGEEAYKQLLDNIERVHGKVRRSIIEGCDK